MISSVYVHVPFCRSKCRYCAFASAVAGPGDEESYLAALADELAPRARLSAPLETLYIGGGTPTALGADAWRRLITLLESSFAFTPGAEVTVEANPCSLNGELLALWRDWRVTRVSVGVQSFDERELAWLGRPHGRSEALRAVESCLESRFAVSIDLMFGLPGGTLRGFSDNLKQAWLLSVGHLSLYQLTVEEGTPLAEEELQLSDGYGPYRYAQWFLPQAGYRQYEVASFARPGEESRHNLNYWRDGEYLGFGPAAWSYADGVRMKNVPELSLYRQRLLRGESPVVSSERLAAEQASAMALVLALRTTRGVLWDEFAARFGQALRERMSARLAHFPPSLVRQDETGAALTKRGLRVANAIWAELI